jgi:hypothetical protein
MTTFSGSDADADPGDGRDPARGGADAIGAAAAWMARVVARVPDTVRTPLPGIVSPLAFAADFAANSQSDVVSITMGNAAVRLISAAADGTSGRLHLRLRWSEGFLAHGLEGGAAVEGGWQVESVSESGAELSRAALTTDARDTTIPMVTVLKTAAPSDDDEFVVRLWGEASDCRGASLRGWART